MGYIKYCLWLILIFFAQACTSNLNDTVSFDQISPEKAKHQVNSDSIIQQSFVNERPKESVFIEFADSLLPNAIWQKWDTLLFADRFGAISNEKWIVKNEIDSVIFLKFQFKDSLRTRNTFFNWLDCFGSNCKSYTVGGNLKIPKRNAIILMDSKSIIYFESNRKNTEVSLRNQLEKEKLKQQWTFAIEIPKKGKTTWKRIDKGIEKPIIKSDEDSE